MQRRNLRIAGRLDAGHVDALGLLYQPGGHEDAFPGVDLACPAIAERRAVRGVETRARVMAKELRPFQEPADLLVRHHPGGEAGDLPQPGQPFGMAPQPAHVVQVFERSEPRRRHKAETARSEAEPRPAAAEEIGKSRPQDRESTFAEAQHGFIDAGAECRRPGKARLARQCHAHVQGDGTIDSQLGLAPHYVHHQRAHVVAGQSAPLGPSGS